MTAGSRGDVAPYTGLGHGLAEAGHEVAVVTHERFGPLVRAAGLDFRGVPVDPRAELAAELGEALHRAGSSAGKLLRLFGRARGLVGEMAGAMLAAAEGAEVLLVNGAVAPLGQVIGEGLGVPGIGVYLQPLAPSREFAPPVIGTGSWGSLVNQVTAQAVNAGLDTVFRDACRDLRARLGLPRRSVGATRRAWERAGWPVFHGFSRHVLPRPADWREGLTVTGYWWPRSAPGARLPDEVEAFLAAGPPPVFVGLGSATVPDPEALSAAVVGALRSAGARGIVQRGWAGLDAGDAGSAGNTGNAAAPDMLTVEDVPHDLLFPRTAAVVHHCGAGTTAAALRAGVPAVPVPVQFDAAFWARRLTSLGVAPRALPLRTLSPGALAAAVRTAVQDPAYAARAAALAARIRAEDGVAPVREALARIAAS